MAFRLFTAVVLLGILVASVRTKRWEGCAFWEWTVYSWMDDRELMRCVCTFMPSVRMLPSRSKIFLQVGRRVFCVLVGPFWALVLISSLSFFCLIGRRELVGWPYVASGYQSLPQMCGKWGSLVSNRGVWIRKDGTDIHLYLMCPSLDTVNCI
jgi:hypothetical protein